MKVLLIDDIMANLRLMQRVLTQNGFEVIIESNPCTALGMVARGHSFHAIIVDFMMPEMNGMEFFKRYQKLSRFQNTPIQQIPPCILITAWSSSFTTEEALDLGFHTVLKKPFTNETLVKALEDIHNAIVFKNRSVRCVNAPFDGQD